MGMAPRLTELWSCRLDHQNFVGIKRKVQTKNHPRYGVVLKAVAIPITRLSAPNLDAMSE
jgi:hypothetical protein